MKKNLFKQQSSKILLKKRIYSSLVQEAYIIPLDFININVVGGCNFKCKICHTWKDVKKKMDYDKCEEFLKSISPFVKKEDVTFCYGGGEPLLHDGVFDLIKLAKRYGYRPSIITNGWLITRSIVEKLVESGLDTIMISLDSNVESVHDEIRGVKGSYKKILNAIDLLDNIKTKLSCDLTIGINTTVNALNLTTIPDLMEWVEHNKKINHIRFQVVTQVFNTSPIDNWYKDDRYSFLWPKDKELVKEIYNKLLSMKKKGYKIESCERNLVGQKDYFLNPDIQVKDSLCGFYKSIFVEVNGDVSMCMLDTPMTNLNSDISHIDFFKKNIPTEQKKIMSCKVINCHYDMNCRYN